MAKVRPAGRMRPSNLFLQPLNLFLIWKKHCKNEINAKNFFKGLIFTQLPLKWSQKIEKYPIKFCYAEFIIMRPHSWRDSFYLALEKKSVAIPDLWPHIITVFLLVPYRFVIFGIFGYRQIYFVRKGALNLKRLKKMY
jgi:hypothetical protein